MKMQSLMGTFANRVRIRLSSIVVIAVMSACGCDSNEVAELKLKVAEQSKQIVKLEAAMEKQHRVVAVTGKYAEVGDDNGSGRKPESDGGHLIVGDVLLCWGSKTLSGGNHVRDFEFTFGHEFAERPAVSIMTDGGCALPPVAPEGFAFSPYRSKITTSTLSGSLVDRRELPTGNTVFMSYLAVGKVKPAKVIEEERKQRAKKLALLQAIVLPLLKEKVAQIDKAMPSEFHHGLKGQSIGRNGSRDEVDDGEKRYDFRGQHKWSEKGGTFGPPGFQYYAFRHPLTVAFDPKTMDYTIATKLEFKVAVAINFDTGFVIKPFVFADSGFGDQWPNEIQVSLKISVSDDKEGKLVTKTTTEVTPKKPLVLQTLHGLVKRDCTPEAIGLLRSEMDKIAAKLDAEVAATKFTLAK